MSEQEMQSLNRRALNHSHTLESQTSNAGDSNGNRGNNHVKSSEQYEYGDTNVIPETENTIFSDLKNFAYSYVDGVTVRSAIDSIFPIVPSLRKGYSWESLRLDVVAGLTLVTILLPQGLAYAPLIGLNSKYGLYNSFFAPLVYGLMGSVREVSLGPFALVSLVVAEQVAQYHPELTQIDIDNPELGAHYHLVHVMSFTFVSSIFLLIMAFLRMGWVVSFISGPAVSGLILASALTISASQMASIFQVSVGQGSFIDLWINMIKQMLDTNMMSLMIGVVCIPLLMATEVIAKKRGMHVPPPMQIILVVVLTFISYLAGFEEKYKVHVVGKINLGFPASTLPDFANLAGYIPGGFVTAVICFIITASVGKHIAAESGEKCNMNNELLALGTCGFFGSFFNCFVSSCSISRSAVVSMMKPRTSLWNVVSALCVLLCILALGPLLYHLPSSLLGAIVIASFRGTYMKIVEVAQVYKRDRYEGVVYAITFLATLCISTEAGLVCAFATSILHLLLKLSSPYIGEIRRIAGTMSYGDVKRYVNTNLDRDVLVLSIDSRIHFANQESICDGIEQAVVERMKMMDGDGDDDGVDDQSNIEMLGDLHNLGNLGDLDNSLVKSPLISSNPKGNAEILSLCEKYYEDLPENPVLTLILNFGGVNDMDLTAIDAFKRCLKGLDSRVFVMYFQVKSRVRTILEKECKVKKSSLMYFDSFDEIIFFAKNCMRLRQAQMNREREEENVQDETV